MLMNIVALPRFDCGMWESTVGDQFKNEAEWQ
jgi:hypothetical protein